MDRDTDQSWQQLDVVTVRDPLAVVEATLENFDFRLEPLTIAAESLHMAAQSAYEASQDEVERCAKLLARILEVVVWSSEGEQPTCFPGAEEIAAFVRAAATTLRSALDDQPGTIEQIEHLTCEAKRRWGEWIDLLDDNNESSEAAAWPEEIRHENASDEDADPAAEADSADVPSAEELARILATMSVSSQSSRHSPSAVTRTQNTGSQNTGSQNTGSQNNGELADGTGTVPATWQTVDIEPELLEAYLDDAARCLASLEAATLSLEQDASDRSSLKQICRELHTMKGASASVGLSDLANHLHAVEDSLQASCDSENASIQVGDILASVDAIRQLVNQLSSQPAAVTHDADGVLHESTHGPTRGPAEFQEGGFDLADTIRVEASRLDRLMDMLAELVMLRNRRESQVAELQTSNDELLRCATTLRGEADNVQTTIAFRERPPLNEIAADFLEIARHQREICQRVSEENLVVSGFIRNFRQELTELQRLPVAGLFRRLQRAVRDAAHREGKQVRLQMLGEHAGLERALQERLYEPLMHIVRNAVSHGIESEPLRVAAGKDPVGTIELEALGGSNLLVLEIRDDGKGLDYDAIRRRGVEQGLIAPQQPTSREELAQLIFHPGFSTKAESSAVSGRGIGMDVVAEALNRMSSWVEVESAANQGTRIRLSIPLRSVIEPTMVIRCAGQLLAVPMQVVHCAGEAKLASRHAGSPGTDLPSIHVHELLSSDSGSEVTAGKRLVIGYSRQVLADSHFGSVPEAGPANRERRFELLVDEIVGPEEVVIRPLPPLLRHQSLFSGITLSGRGEVVLLFDSRRLIELGLRCARAPQPLTSLPAHDSAVASLGKKVLVADDSISARRCLARLLRQHGLEVTEVSDGLEALEQLQSNEFIALFSDLEMPRAGGLELLREMATMPERDQIPVVIASSRGEDTFQQQAMQLGAKDYLLKPVVGSQIAEALERLGLVPRGQTEGDNR